MLSIENTGLRDCSGFLQIRSHMAACDALVSQTRYFCVGVLKNVWSTLPGFCWHYYVTNTIVTLYHTRLKWLVYFVVTLYKTRKYLMKELLQRYLRQQNFHMSVPPHTT